MAAAPPPPTTNLGRAAAHPCSGVRRAFSCQPPPTWRVGSGTHLSGAVCVGPPRSDRTGRAGARSVSTHALGLHPQGQSCVCRIHVRDRKTATAPQHPVTNGVVRSARTCHGEFWMFPFGYARPTDANLEATTANCHNRHHGRPGQGTAVEANRATLLEANFNVFRFIWRVCDRTGHYKDFFSRLIPGVFQRARFNRATE